MLDFQWSQKESKEKKRKETKEKGKGKKKKISICILLSRWKQKHVQRNPIIGLVPFDHIKPVELIQVNLLWR